MTSSPQNPLGQGSDPAATGATRLEARSPSEPQHAPASCPLGLAINTIGGRWKLHILRHLLLKGPQRYNVLLDVIDGVSAKELTRNLRELESARLVMRSEVGPSRAYELTPLGMELEAPLRALGIFGAVLAEGRARRAPS